MEKTIQRKGAKARRREVERDAKRLVAFFEAYDAWPHSPDGCGGFRFDAMVEARGEIENLFPCADEEVES